jgi:Zn-finger nucleic acid-binding protein
MIATCPDCGAPLHTADLPVRAERRGRLLVEIEVEFELCTRCDWVGIDDDELDEAIAQLHRHTLPGDDIVLPQLGYDA